MTNIRGAIFDIDGTLIDSMQIWDNAAADYLKNEGVIPSENLNEELREMGGSEIPVHFRQKYGVEKTEDEIANEISLMIMRRLLDEAPLKEGVLDVLNLFKEIGIKMCAATASPRLYIEPVLEKFGILDYLERIFTCDEEKTSKSKPDIYIRASKYLRTGITDSLVFEDALYAIRTARKAGFPVVGLYDFSSKMHQGEIKKISSYYYSDMKEFIADFRKLRTSG